MKFAKTVPLIFIIIPVVGVLATIGWRITSANHDGIERRVQQLRSNEADARLHAFEQHFDQSITDLGSALEALRYSSASGRELFSAGAKGIYSWAWVNQKGDLRATGEFSGPFPPSRELRNEALGVALKTLRSLPLNQARAIVSVKKSATAGSDARYLVYLQRTLVNRSEWLIALFDGQMLLPRQIEPGMRVFLVDSNGFVLAHSQIPYIGASFGASLRAQDQDQVLVTSSSGISQHHSSYLAVDRLRVAAAYKVRADYGMRLAAERVLPPVSATHLTQNLRLFGILSGIGILITLLFSYLIASFRRLKRTEAAMPELPTLESVFALRSSQSEPTIVPTRRRPVPLIPTPPNPAEQSVEVLALHGDAAQALQEALKSMGQTKLQGVAVQQQEQAVREKIEDHRRFERECVETFTQETARLPQPRQIAERLTEAASRLCQSQTLFFAYHEGAASALLVAHSGFAAAQAPLGLTFPLAADAVRRILELSVDQAPVSLAQFEPLARLLLGRVNVAHFEAWSITGYRKAMNRDLGRPRLLGILVILQPGVDSVLHQNSLLQLLQTTGARYEGAISLR